MNMWIENAQLGSALLKGSGLLLVTAIAVCLMRKASAASQFRVCFVGLCMSLLVAVASVVASMSNLEYSLLHSLAVPNTDSLTLISTERFAVDHSHEFSHTSQSSLARGAINFPRDSDESTNRLLGSLQSSSSPTSLQSESNLAAKTGLAPQQPVGLMGITEGEVEPVGPAFGQSWMQPFSRYWPCLWGTGAAVVFLRLLVPFWLSTKASRRFEKLKDSALVHLNENLARQLQIPTPALWLCSESITPFVVGLWQPKIVLPTNARTWSDQRLTFVLLHEMAHIKRRAVEKGDAAHYQ